MATQGTSRIISTDDVLGGKPRVEQVEGRGRDPHEVAGEHDLDVADVYHALAYFYAHPEEMKRIEETRETLLDGLEADPDVVTSPDDLPSSDT
jgi:uncharacterized protein (DUF433 family)